MYGAMFDNFLRDLVILVLIIVAVTSGVSYCAGSMGKPSYEKVCHEGYLHQLVKEKNNTYLLPLEDKIECVVVKESN